MQTSRLESFRGESRRGAEEVFSALVQAISIGELRAGDKLPPEGQLATEFDVAPMTLRQALQQLRDLGFVDTRRGRNGGTYIKDDIAARLESLFREQEVTVVGLRDLTDWRRAISGEASALAAERGTAEELKLLAGYADEYHQVYLHTAERRLADSRFHIFIAEMARNPHLLEAEREIQEQLTRVLRVFPQAASDCGHDFAQHVGLLEAIEQADSERARTELQQHVEATFDWATRQRFVTGEIAAPGKSEPASGARRDR